MCAVFQTGRKSGVNIGAVGHVDMGKTTLSKAIDIALRARANKSDRKRDRAIEQTDGDRYECWKIVN
jgi:translation elongation factor EF-Tu-like GTPase